MRVEPKKLMVAVRFKVFASAILVLDMPCSEVFPHPVPPEEAAVLLLSVPAVLRSNWEQADGSVIVKYNSD